MNTSFVSWISRILFYIGSVAFVFLIAVLFVSVISRYCFGHAFSWSEEVCSFIFLWVSYIGIVLAMENDSHLRIDTILVYMPTSIRRLFDIANMLIVISFCLVLTWLGVDLVGENMDLEQYAISVPVSISAVSIVIPLSFLAMSLYCLQNLIKLLKTPVEEKR